MIRSERLSRESASTSVGRASSASLSLPVTDLERRLATDQTLDIFTMKPKVFHYYGPSPSTLIIVFRLCVFRWHPHLLPTHVNCVSLLMSSSDLRLRRRALKLYIVGDIYFYCQIFSWFVKGCHPRNCCNAGLVVLTCGFAIRRWLGKCCVFQRFPVKVGSHPLSLS